jgi:hypothetical protein
LYKAGPQGRAEVRLPEQVGGLLEDQVAPRLLRLVRDHLFAFRAKLLELLLH